MYALPRPTGSHTPLPSSMSQTAPFAPIQTRRTFEAICERIRSRLVSGELKPGDKLPAERELSLQLGVGRNALREAIRSLEIAGILELRKGVKGGAFIRSGDPERMNMVMQDMFSLGSISIAELAETRVHVQDLVMRLVCERGSEEDFAALDANIDRTERMTAEGRFLDRVEMSREFYRLLGSATGNAVVAMIVHSVTEILMQFVDARVAAGGAPQPQLVARRREIVAALRARDAERACRLMREHLAVTHRMLESDPQAAPAKAPTKTATKSATKAATKKAGKAATKTAKPAIKAATQAAEKAPAQRRRA